MSPNEAVIVAIGSNQGDRIALVREAVKKLADFASSPIVGSSLYETDPIDCPPGSEPFINAVAAFSPLTNETPDSLLLKLQSLEREFGRQLKTILNEPRPLDLDLIAFCSLHRATQNLILPHPRAHLRRFVLAPLSEIFPELILPGQTKTVSQLLSELTENLQRIRKMPSSSFG